MTETWMDIFMREYYVALKTPPVGNPIRDRSEGFRIIFEELLKIQGRIGIMETGTIRPDYGWEFGNDGLSTYLFDQFAIIRGNVDVCSVDNNKKNVKFAASKVSDNTNIHLGDSVLYLDNIAAVPQFNLLYLDSHDLTVANPDPARLHCLYEFCAALPVLNEGAIVAVDDHRVVPGLIGKGMYVQDALEKIGAEKLYEGYQIVYRMP